MKIMFSSALALILASALNAAPNETNTQPAGAIILADGATTTLEGTVAVRASGSQKMFALTELSGNVYERHTLYYPANMPLPGDPPRPPFLYKKVTEVLALGADGVDLSASSGKRVRLTGTWTLLRQPGQPRSMGLLATKVEAVPSAPVREGHSLGYWKGYRIGYSDGLAGQYHDYRPTSMPPEADDFYQGYEAGYAEGSSPLRP